MIIPPCDHILDTNIAMKAIFIFLPGTALPNATLVDINLTRGGAVAFEFKWQGTDRIMLVVDVCELEVVV